MTSVTPVPELAARGERVTAREAWRVAGDYGWWRLVRETFVRFRFGDGFSHARAFGLQLSLAAIPLTIAGVGLASVLQTETAGLLLRRTMLELTPRASDDLLRSTISPFTGDSAVNVAAMVLGLLAAVVALTTVMGQLERGANRLYGIERDRPSTRKYLRAFVLALFVGLPAMVGFVLLVSAKAFADAVQDFYGVDAGLVLLATGPLGLALLLGAVTVMLRQAPDRTQPGYSLLGLGGMVALVLWTLLTSLLAAFLELSSEVGTVYGPLTGVMALLLWAQLTAMALFLGLALSAQLEAACAGMDAADPDPVRAAPPDLAPSGVDPQSVP